jgi:xanthine dehydrogenase molybdenum-binding subunit
VDKRRHIVALTAEAFVMTGCYQSIYDVEGRGVLNPGAKNNLFLYGPNIPNWSFTVKVFRSNTPYAGCTRSCPNQEFKWAIECSLDEMAFELGVDPLEFRMEHVAKPGQSLSPVKDWDFNIGNSPEVEDGRLKFDSYASMEVVRKAAAVFGWKKRIASEPGSSKNRFKRGVGVSISHHHGGFTPYAEYEYGFKALNGTLFRSTVELDQDGHILLKNAMPDSGTDHDTGIAQQVAEVLGLSSIDMIRLQWGDSDNAPVTGSWYAGRTNTCQGGAAVIAAEKLRKELLKLASKELGIDTLHLICDNGSIWSKSNPHQKLSFVELRKNAGRRLAFDGEVKTPEPTRGRAPVMDVGAVFVEVEVDTWTGKWRVTQVIQSVDTGNLINPLLAEGDMDGAFMQGLNTTNDAVPWARDFPGFLSVMDMGFLDYTISNFKDLPESMKHVFVQSLEPRWFFGIKGFAETDIGVIPPSIANAIFHACGVRVRNLPITQNAVITALSEKNLLPWQ